MQANTAASLTHGMASADIAAQLNLSHGTVRLMAVTFDAVRAASWASRARHGWDSQLGRLARRLAPRAAQNACETPTK